MFSSFGCDTTTLTPRDQTIPSFRNVFFFRRAGYICSKRSTVPPSKTVTARRPEFFLIVLLSQNSSCWKHCAIILNSLPLSVCTSLKNIWAKKKKKLGHYFLTSSKRKSKGNTRSHYLSIREIWPAALAISLASAAGLTRRGGRAGGAAWPGAWLEDEVETGPPTPTLPPRTPSSVECCLEDCEFCDSQRRPAFRVTTVGPAGPGWWPIVLPLSSDVLCNRNPRPFLVGAQEKTCGPKLRQTRLLRRETWICLAQGVRNNYKRDLLI